MPAIFIIHEEIEVHGKSAPISGAVSFMDADIISGIISGELTALQGDMFVAGVTISLDGGMSVIDGHLQDSAENLIYIESDIQGLEGEVILIPLVVSGDLSVYSGNIIVSDENLVFVDTSLTGLFGELQQVQAALSNVLACVDGYISTLQGEYGVITKTLGAIEGDIHIIQDGDGDYSVNRLRSALEHFEGTIYAQNGSVEKDSFLIPLDGYISLLTEEKTIMSSFMMPFVGIMFDLPVEFDSQQPLYTASGYTVQASTVVQSSIGEFPALTESTASALDDLAFIISVEFFSTAAAEDSVLFTVKRALRSLLNALVSTVSTGEFAASGGSFTYYTDKLVNVLGVLLASEGEVSDELLYALKDRLKSELQAFSDLTALGEFTSVNLSEARIIHALSYTLPYTLSSSVEGSDQLNIGRLMRLVDQMRASGSAISIVEAAAALYTAEWVRDVISLRQGATLLSLVESTSQFFSDVISVIKLLGQSEVVDSTTSALFFLLGLNSDSDVEDTVSSQQEAVAKLLSQGHGALFMLALDDERYIGHVMNTNTDAFSYYKNVEFDALVWSYNDKALYGTKPDGVYVFDSSDDDEGEPIQAYVKTGVINFTSNQLKQMDVAYLGYAGGELRLQVVTTMGGKKQINTYKLLNKPALKTTEGIVKLSKGVRSAYWQFELQNIEGSDFEVDKMTLYPIHLSRSRNS